MNEGIGLQIVTIKCYNIYRLFYINSIFDNFSCIIYTIYISFIHYISFMHHLFPFFSFYLEISNRFTVIKNCRVKLGYMFYSNVESNYGDVSWCCDFKADDESVVSDSGFPRRVPRLVEEIALVRTVR